MRYRISEREKEVIVMNTEHEVLVAAHRGNSAFFPENTIPAFESAIALGVDNMELDVHMTRDKRIVLMHDHTLDRTTDGTGFVRLQSLAELRKLDAGGWKGAQFAGIGIPLLEELLELVKDHPTVTLNVELKDYPKTDRAWAFECADETIALIERYGLGERCFINSFSGEILEYLDEKYEKRYKLHGFFPVSLMGENLKRDPFDYLFCMCVIGDKENPVPEKEVFDRIIARKIQPWVHYANDAETAWQQAVERGAQLITANDPAKALTWLRGIRRHA